MKKNINKILYITIIFMAMFCFSSKVNAANNCAPTKEDCCSGCPSGKAETECQKELSEAINKLGFSCNTQEVEDNASSSNEDIVYNTKTIYCGGTATNPTVKDIPEGLPKFTRRLFSALKYLIPVILIIFGIIDFFKSATSSDEKQMAEGPRRFVRRIIVSVLIFFIVILIQFVLNIISNSAAKAGSTNPVAGITDCINCFTSKSIYCKK